jgi:hypothetical protein
MTHRYWARRHALWLSNDATFDQFISEDRDPVTWDRPSDLPAVRVTEQLSCALECMYAGDQRRAEVFLHRASRNADRMLAEKRYLDTEIAETGHPRSIAEILRSRIYARWLLGEPLNKQELRRVAEHLVTWCLTKPDDHEHFDSPITMDAYIQAVRAAMIACDLDYASELLKTRQSLRWNFGQQRSLFGRLIQMYPDVTDAFDIEFEAFFDKIRDPDYHDGPQQRAEEWVPHDREMLALETGVIREMYVVRASPHDPVDPQAVIDAVAY